MTSPPTLQLEPDLDVAEFIHILKRSTLSERRPINDIDAMTGMIRNADVIATARNADGVLVGVARSITDFHYCTYLSDLAVDVDCQRRGIGKQLIDLSHQAAGLSTNLILLAAPAAVDYYPHIGFAAHDSCWLRKSL